MVLAASSTPAGDTHGRGLVLVGVLVLVGILVFVGVLVLVLRQHASRAGCGEERGKTANGRDSSHSTPGCHELFVRRLVDALVHPIVRRVVDALVHLACSSRSSDR